MLFSTEGQELVDAEEVARRLGLKNARTVLDLRVHRLGFPPPVGRQGRSLLWSWAQVEMWGISTSDALGSSSSREPLGLG